MYLNRVAYFFADWLGTDCCCQCFRDVLFLILQEEGAKFGPSSSNFELVSYAFWLSWFFHHCLRQWVNGLVSVDLLLAKLPRKHVNVTNGYGIFLLAAFTIVIGTVFSQNDVMFERGDVSQDLGIPSLLLRNI